MGTRTNSGSGKAKQALERPVTDGEQKALAKLVDGQQVALAETQQADHAAQVDGMNNLARFGALLTSVNRAVGQAMREAADHSTP
jgi:hypothetical protein